MNLVDSIVPENTDPRVGELFREISEALTADAAILALERMAAYFQATGDFHRLFEARKYQARLRAGLPPLLTKPLDFRSSPAAAEVERSLLAACREVGQLLASTGQLAAAWAYLQPLDDEPFIHAAIESVPIHENAISEIIQIALFERAHPIFGFRLLLQHLGTCQAISTFDAVALALNETQRQRLAEELVQHVHRELSTNLRRGLEDREGQSRGGQENWLENLLLDETEWIRQTAPHLDATHLVSTMRIALQVQTHSLIRMAVDLASYGQLLPDILQYSGDPPFESTYQDYLIYFRSLANRDGEKAAEHFLAKSVAAQDLDSRQAAREAAVSLLFRTEHFDRALREALVAGPEFGMRGMAPSLIEIARKASDAGGALESCRVAGDLLGFAAIDWCRKFEGNTM